jgi:AraC family transcriptional regulator of adaptative response / DNA-3-methyladenine glycosylase II
MGVSRSAERKEAAACKRQNDGITVALGYRPPYLWEHILNFLAGRAIKGIEVVKDGEYLRTVDLNSANGRPINGWVRVTNRVKTNALEVTLSETLLPVLPQVLARVKNLFDLYCAPDTVYQTLQTMNELRPGLCSYGIRLPGCFAAFEMAARAVLGQQITVKAAGTLAARIVTAYGTPIHTGVEGLTHTFPSPENILSLGERIEENFGSLGVISARAGTIYALASSFVKGEIDFSACIHPEDWLKKLTSIRGIGNWTAQYIAMRVMQWPDAFLETDVGVKKALPGYNSKELLKMAEAWRPWRSYAVVNLWNSL